MPAVGSRGSFEIHIVVGTDIETMEYTPNLVVNKHVYTN